MSFNIIGTGSAYPEKVVTNDDLATFLDTSDEWIRTRTGVRERRVCTMEKINDLAVVSANKALKDAKLEASDIDLVICATLGGDFITPSTACYIQKEIGAKCPAFDINAACSGFLYALDVAEGYFKRDRVKNVLITVAECMSDLLNWEDRATCVLFGDAAASVVLTKGEGLKSIYISATGNSDVLRINATRNDTPWKKQGEKEGLSMNGQEVFKFAVSSMVKDIRRVVKEAGIKEEDINVVLPHQANIRIIDFAKEKLNVPNDRFYTNLEHFGNTSAVGIPLLLDELNHSEKLKKGDLIAMSAFGGGLTSGACIIEWNK